MNRRKFLSYLGCGCCGFILNSCSSAPITDRKQLKIISESKLNAKAAQIYEQVKEKEKMSNDLKTLNEIKNIGKKIENSIYSLELFHGPTLAFKDIGAKFMASCLDYFKDSYTSKKITVLVATSGDTGGAVANGFSDTSDIDVCILYPKGKISEVQKKQITTDLFTYQSVNFV